MDARMIRVIPPAKGGTPVPSVESDAPDERDPQPCPRCGVVCTYDGWGHVHPNGIGISSCVTPPAKGNE